MKRVLALAAVFVAGCASGPSSEARAVECAQIESELAQAERTHAAALRKQQNAWKTVIPVIVAAVYVSAQSEVADAEQRIAERRNEIASRGCT